MTISKFIKNLNLNEETDEIVFFGGSFNPWHSGHSSCLQLIPNDKMVVVMPDHNPFKNVTNQKDRLSSIEDLGKELKVRPKNTHLYGGFIQEDTHNPTHNWLQQVKNDFPKNKFSLLMGFDSFMSIDKWIEAKSILSNTFALYVVSRLDDKPARDVQKKLLESMSPDIGIEFLGHHDYEHLSSTEIRSSKNNP